MIPWYEKAAKQGYVYAENNLGISYMQTTDYPHAESNGHNKMELKWITLENC
jgi:hypothetical protein